MAEETPPAVGPLPEPWKHHSGLIGEAYQADVILYSGEVDTRGADRITYFSKRPNRRENVFLLLATRGGSAHSAFRLTRALQNHYKKLILYIYGMCKSAGTLVAVGMDEIVLSDYGEFGPLDVQFGKRDELFESTSGLDINQALISLEERTFSFFEERMIYLRLERQLSTQLASDLALKLATEVYRAIFSQVDPTQLGANERAMRIAMRYGEKLQRANLHKGALERLVSGYPSHGFVIDLTEASTLFTKVRAPSEAEEQLGECIPHLTRDQIDLDDGPLVALLNEPVAATLEPQAVATKAKESELTHGGKPDGESPAAGGNGGSEDHPASDSAPDGDAASLSVAPLQSGQPVHS